MAEAYSTYSFQDATLTLYDSSDRFVSTTGQGMGSITIGYSSSHSEVVVANDGHAVISKIKDDTGTLDIECQQSSPLHRTLIKWYNRLYTSGSATDWAGITGEFKNVSTGEQKQLIGVAFDKIPDAVYGKTADSVTWHFVVAKIVTNVIA